QPFLHFAQCATRVMVNWKDAGSGAEGLIVAVPERTAPFRNKMGSLRMNGVGQSREKSFAKSRTSVPPSGRRADTSSELTPGIMAGRKAKKSLWASTRTSDRSFRATEGFAVSVRSETVAALTESEK